MLLLLLEQIDISVKLFHQFQTVNKNYGQEQLMDK